MEKKFKLTDETKTIIFDDGNKVTLHRIQALRDFGNVKAGDLGGWIQTENNLSHEGNCWVYDEAMVFQKAIVKEEAKVVDQAWVADQAVVEGQAEVRDKAVVVDQATVGGSAVLIGIAVIMDSARVEGMAIVKDWAVKDQMIIDGNTVIDSGIHD